MEENKDLNEQKAPLKNTDNAFVKVGEDGKPTFDEKKSATNEEGQQANRKDIKENDGDRGQR